MTRPISVNDIHHTTMLTTQHTKMVDPNNINMFGTTILSYMHYFTIQALQRPGLA